MEDPAGLLGADHIDEIACTGLSGGVRRHDHFCFFAFFDQVYHQKGDIFQALFFYRGNDLSDDFSDVHSLADGGENALYIVMGRGDDMAAVELADTLCGGSACVNRRLYCADMPRIAPFI